MLFIDTLDSNAVLVAPYHKSFLEHFFVNDGNQDQDQEKTQCKWIDFGNETENDCSNHHQQTYAQEKSA